MRRHLVATLLIGLFFAMSGAQETKKSAANTEVEVDVHFLNGSLLRMTVLTEKLDIDTAYGKLAVPVRDIRSIEFGSHMPEGYAEKIDAAVKNLGKNDFREREKAAAALVELGPYSYAAAVAASQIKEAEVATRAKGVIEKLQLKFARKDLKIDADDKVVARNFTIVGRIATPKIKARTELFGDAEMSLAKMRTLSGLGVATPDLSVVVEASKYATQNGWLATNFYVDGKSPIVITAKGTVDLDPTSPGDFVVGPNGTRVLGGPAGGIAFGGKKAKGGVSASPGLLVGKIGADGDTFTIGVRYEGTPLQTGPLYLHINPSPYNPQPSGQYDVRATRKQD